EHCQIGPLGPDRGVANYPAEHPAALLHRMRGAFGDVARRVVLLGFDQRDQRRRLADRALRMRRQRPPIGAWIEASVGHRAPIAKIAVTTLATLAQRMRRSRTAAILCQRVLRSITRVAPMIAIA